MLRSRIQFRHRAAAVVANIRYKRISYRDLLASPLVTTVSSLMGRHEDRNLPVAVTGHYRTAVSADVIR